MAAQTFTLRLQSQRGGGARLSSFIHSLLLLNPR